LPFGDDAEFEARADRDVAAAASCLLEIIRGRLVEVRLRRDRGQLLARLPRHDRPAPAAVLDPGAMADETAVQRPPRGREHHAQARRTVDDQADVDGIIVAAANELPGAVER